MNMRLLVTFIFLGMFMFAIDSYALNNNGPHDPALKKNNYLRSRSKAGSSTRLFGWL